MRASSISVALVGLAALLVAADGRAADNHKVLTLSATPDAPPFWIAAEAATTRSGELDYNVFAPGLGEIVRTQAINVTARRAESADASTPCPTFTVASDDGPPAAMSTWSSALENSDAVVSGTVVAVTPGFFMVAPASMLTVRVDAAAGSHAAYPSGLTLMVRYMGADFQIGSSRFCNGGSRMRAGESFLPKVNDRILIFAFGEPRQSYLAARDENLVFGRNDRITPSFVFTANRSLPDVSSFDALARAALREKAALAPKAHLRGER